MHYEIAASNTIDSILKALEVQAKRKEVMPPEYYLDAAVK